MADISPKDEIFTETSNDSETLLCLISYDKLRNLLIIYPDFIDDSDCYVVNGNGMSYDYWIEHASKKASSRELQKRKDNIKKVKKTLEKNHVLAVVCCLLLCMQRQNIINKMRL